MIRDPGGASPNENQDSPPSPKYDRTLSRPPPLDETEIPLDMTVRRKDSSDGQGSPTGIGDGPVNLNVRPSVITKAPPQPIKKRISHMHNNGEIVLKSSIRTTTTTQSSTTVESAPIVNVSATYCDVSIEEHFRRSLGPTYSSIYGDKQQLQQQHQPLLNVLNNNTSQSGVPPFSPERAPAQALQPKVHPLPLPLLMQQQKQHTAMETSDSPPLGSATGPPVGMRNHSSSSISSSSSVSSNSSLSSSSSTSSSSSSSSSSLNNNISIRPMRVVAPDTIELKRSSDPTPPVPLVPATVLPPSPGAPAGSAASVAIALTSPKHLHQPPPPAISPAVSLSTTTMSLASSSPSSSLASSPAPPLPQHHQQKRPGESPGEEVDDHFAKALGDTWKKIQESNMNL
uniref:Transcription cofactor vestigial-like protein 4 n=1 Tax=Anopheles dirus TaxID=7168 RepID=A0A182NPF6_9DIPT